MSRITIKSLQDRIAVIEQSREEWKDRAYKAEAKVEKKIIDNEWGASLEKTRYEAEWRGKYEGFKEAVWLFLRTETDAKFEIESRTKEEIRNNRY